MDKKKKATLALGNFDGVHIGHKKIIQKAIDVSGSKSDVYVCAFEPHPLYVLLKNPPRIITPLNEKIRIIEKLMGVNYFGMKFDMHLAKETGEEFILGLLDKFEVKNIVVGANYFFGNKALYSTKDLQELGKKYFFNVYVVRERKQRGRVISSTRIRRNLNKGDVKTVNKLLGRHYRVSGVCEKGVGLCSIAQFPSVDIAIEACNRYPRSGIYATKTIIEGTTHASITNLSYDDGRVSGRSGTMETHIFGLQEMPQGQSICVEFIKKIRDEKELDTEDKIKEQLKEDIKKVGRHFN